MRVIIGNGDSKKLKNKPENHFQYNDLANNVNKIIKSTLHNV